MSSMANANSNSKPDSTVNTQSINSDNIRGQLGNDKLNNPYIDFTTSDGLYIGDPSNTETRANLGQPLNLGLSDSSISEAKLIDGSVTTDKLATDSVTLDKMANNSVNTANIVDRSITYAKLGQLAVLNEHFGEILSVANGGSAAATLSGILRGNGTAAFTGTTGKLLKQYVTTSTATFGSTATAIPTDNTIPQSGEGAAIVSVAITPTNASNLLKVTFSSNVSASAAAVVTTSLFNGGSGAIYAQGASIPAGGSVLPICWSYFLGAGSTSSMTFSVRYGPSTGTAYINGVTAANIYGGVDRTLLIVEEYES